jgi:hypothetical protein
VLVVDEAGMLATRQFAELVDSVAAVRGKLVLVGDHRQLPELGGSGSDWPPPAQDLESIWASIWASQPPIWASLSGVRRSPAAPNSAAATAEKPS